MQDCTMNNLYNVTGAFQCVCVRVYKMFLALGSDMADLVFLSSNTTRDTRISLVWWPFAQPPGSYHRPGVGLSLGLYVCVFARGDVSGKCSAYAEEKPNQTSVFYLSHLQIYTWSVCPCSSFNILARSHPCKSTRET